jgi:hypothetical protein
MDENKKVNHAMLAMEGRTAWMAAWDAAWAEADRRASEAVKLLASRSECRNIWSAAIVEARELTLSQQEDAALRTAWAVAWDTAIAVSKVSLEKRKQRKTVYYPPSKLAPAWNTTWTQAIEAVVMLLDKSETKANVYWNGAINAARGVFEKNKVKDLPPLAAGHVIGDAAWAAVCCAVNNAEWNAVWNMALEAARSEIKEKDLVSRDDWGKSWAEVRQSVAEIVEKNCPEDSNATHASHAGRVAWDAAWAAAGDAVWVADTSSGLERTSWNSAVAAAKAELEKSRIEWDLSSPQKWDREGRTRRGKEGRIAGASAWNAAYRAEVGKPLQA